MEDKSLHSKASQETFISLLNLDPAPMETPPPDTDKELPPVPEEGHGGDGSDSRSRPDSTGSKGTSSVGLSGSGNSAIYFRPSLTPPLFPISAPTRG